MQSGKYETPDKTWTLSQVPSNVKSQKTKVKIKIKYRVLKIIYIINYNIYAYIYIYLYIYIYIYYMVNWLYNIPLYKKKLDSLPLIFILYLQLFGSST